MPKKIFTIVVIILILFLVFSIFIYSSTFNTYTQNRLIKLGSHEAPIERNSTIPQSVCDEVYDDCIETDTSTQSFVKPEKNNLINKESSKVVYITIDDGPDPHSTPEYLSVLEKKEVKATFFMIGSQMERYPELVKQIDSKGHAIGNHSYSHNYSTLYSSAEKFKEEIQKADAIVYSITGKHSKVFRAPGGSTKMHDIEFDNILSEFGYIIFDWNVSAADTDPHGITKSQVVYNIEHESRGLKKVIVLMHDNSKRKASFEALPEVIEWFKEKGYQFKVLDQNTLSMRLKRKVSPSNQDLAVDKSAYEKSNIPNNKTIEPEKQNH